jgi:hypothetical protein
MESLGFCVDSRRAKDGGLGHKSGLGVNGLGGPNRVPPVLVLRADHCEFRQMMGSHSAIFGSDVAGSKLLCAGAISPCALELSRRADCTSPSSSKRNRVRLHVAEALIVSAADSPYRVLRADEFIRLSMMIPQSRKTTVKTNDNLHESNETVRNRIEARLRER